ncbi:hypothetical protein ACQKNC_05795 [Lysinibacillus sp. NPDC094177]|uniref:hypothetical protein n=1 Tax=Lysinibacillus sp. NPDC094177 TaxID=3390580 RepID=UPI003CFC7C2E
MKALTTKKPVCVDFVGLYFIVQSQATETSEHYIGIVYGLIAACFYTVVTFTYKYIRGLKEPDNTIIQLALAALLLALYLLGTNGFQVMQIDIKSISLLISLGALSMLGSASICSFWEWPFSKLTKLKIKKYPIRLDI